MKMKNPPHPGEIVADNLAELGVTVKAAAEALGVTRQQLHKVISGRSGVTPEMAVRLEKAIGGTSDAWLRMQMDYELAHIDPTALNVRRLAPA